jgi:secondary thiamine-phosphate synthase enzyme
MLKSIAIQTPAGENITNVTEQVKAVVRESGVQEGICVIFTPHTTGAVTVNSVLDPMTVKDLVEEMHRLVPTRVDFNHIYDTPADASGHIKSTLVGVSQALIVTGGELLLGGSQFIMFFEFDGPRQRQLHVRVLSE